MLVCLKHIYNVQIRQKYFISKLSLQQLPHPYIKNISKIPGFTCTFFARKKKSENSIKYYNKQQQKSNIKCIMFGSVSREPLTLKDLISLQEIQQKLCL